MTELKRLLVNHDRIRESYEKGNYLELTVKENHYLSRVLRLKRGDQFNVIDGMGNLWTADFIQKNIVRLCTDLGSPSESCAKPYPEICLAVAVPKIGFDDVLRMSCEIGIDTLLPINTERSLYNDVSCQRFARWQAILNEAVEQSERLWKPKLKDMTSFSDWTNTVSDNSLFTIGTTRLDDAIYLEKLLLNLDEAKDEIWVAIGPEGGWTDNELDVAKKKNCIYVEFGESILRTSTAAISACQLLCSWRRSSSYVS